MLDTAEYFEQRRDLDKAVLLYQKAGKERRALELCFSANLVDTLAGIASSLTANSDPAVMARCGMLSQVKCVMARCGMLSRFQCVIARCGTLSQLKRCHGTLWYHLTTQNSYGTLWYALASQLRHGTPWYALTIQMCHGTLWYTLTVRPKPEDTIPRTVEEPSQFAPARMNIASVYEYHTLAAVQPLPCFCINLYPHHPI